MKRRILIVDDDPWIRQMVSTMLTNAGYEIQTADNGADALDKTSVFKPDLVVSDVMMDKMDGWSFVHALRSTAEFSLTPVIFLTALDSPKDRVKGFKLGADDYLAKPFQFEELQLRILRTFRTMERMQQRAEAIKRHDDPNVALKGDLAQLGLSAVLTIFELERKSGILVIQGEKERARIFLRQGRVLSAVVDGAGIRGAAAVYRALSWSAGHFSFSALDVDMEDEINIPVTHLLMEAARLLDEGAETSP